MFYLRPVPALLRIVGEVGAGTQAEGVAVARGLLTELANFLTAADPPVGALVSAFPSLPPRPCTFPANQVNAVSC